MVLKLLLITIVVVLVAGVVAAREDESGVTPYGDYCVACAVYGVCKTAVPMDDAVRAIDRYYRDRGYRVGEIQQRGRFIEAVIYKEERAVDRVIFDRKTGRLRSIY